MDAQWQQFYWQHYLLQQQQQQQQPTTQQSQATTGTYGPMTHSVRTQQAHDHHPYTPSSANSQTTHTPSPSTNQPFPPPPPPPLPTAAPTTPNAASFKHSPTHQAPPAPPSTVPFPQPPLQDRLSLGLERITRPSTSPHHTAHTMVTSCRHRWTSHLRCFSMAPRLPWYGRLHGQDSEPRKVLWPHSNTQHY